MCVPVLLSRIKQETKRVVARKKKPEPAIEQIEGSVLYPLLYSTQTRDTTSMTTGETHFCPPIHTASVDLCVARYLQTRMQRRTRSRRRLVCKIVYIQQESAGLDQCTSVLQGKLWFRFFDAELGM